MTTDSVVKTRGLRHRWASFLALLSNIGPQPSGDEIILILKESQEAGETLFGFREDVWRNTLDRGGFSVRNLREVEERFPEFAAEAKRLRLALEAEPAQTELAIRTPTLG